MKRKDIVIEHQEQAYYRNTGELHPADIIAIEKAANRASMNAQEPNEVGFSIGDHVTINTLELKGNFHSEPIQGIVKRCEAGVLIIQTETGFTVTRLPHQVTRRLWVSKRVRFEHYSGEILGGYITHLGGDYCKVNTDNGVEMTVMLHEII